MPFSLLSANYHHLHTKNTPFICVNAPAQDVLFQLVGTCFDNAHILQWVSFQGLMEQK